MNSTDLDQRLGLYQVFLKLYEHHRGLLDEILELENTGSPWRTRAMWLFVQGVVQDGQVYLTTNLLDGKTQQLNQPEQIWVIGRDRTLSLPIQDKRLSRRHAVIQHRPNEGFYLIDLNSTNGSYINGESVRRPTLLQDGDRVRLGSLTFIFFACCTGYTAHRLPAELHTQIQSCYSNLLSPSESETLHDIEAAAVEAGNPSLVNGDNTSLFLKPPTSSVASPSGTSALNLSQQSEILDRFLHRAPDHRN